jgi:hypothetical protein
LQEHTAEAGPADLGEVTTEVRIARNHRWALGFTLLSTLGFLVWLAVDSFSTLAGQPEATQVPLRLGLALLFLAVVAWTAREFRLAFATSLWIVAGGLRIRVGGTRVEIPWTDVRRVRLVTRNNAVSSLVFETPHGNHRLPDGLENLLVLLIACRDQGLLDEDELPASYRAILRSTEPPRT